MEIYCVERIIREMYSAILTSAVELAMRIRCQRVHILWVDKESPGKRVLDHCKRIKKAGTEKGVDGKQRKDCFRYSAELKEILRA
jgi:hypothetical protein